jgi:hypothetical protein
MSIKSFLTKLWTTIKKLFQGFDQEIKVAIQTAVLIVENLKNYAESAEADALTAIIPGELDDNLKNWLRQKLPDILKRLKLADEAFNNDEEVIASATKQLKSLPNEYRNGFLHTLSILIAQIIADGRLTWQDGVYVLQWYYQHQFKTKKN